jgi:hypothetical protein
MSMETNDIIPSINENTEPLLDGKGIVEEPKKKKKKNREDDNKSAQSMIKTMLTNLVRLSELADQKAGLMISVNSIIISIILSFIFTNDNFNQKLLIPSGILVSVSIFTIIFSVFATKPKLGLFKSNKVHPEDILFFNSYAKMDINDYREQMLNLIENEKELNVKLIDNIHAQGVVLKRKYKQIGIAYSIFLIGFPIAVAYFIYCNAV